ncbi:MAG: 3-oxoacid CoA-transferase subunit A [Clostridia bacterium]
MRNKIITTQEAVDLIPDGATIMLGGFVGCGSALQIIDGLSKSGKGHFHTIMNDSSMLNGPDGEEYYSWAKLIHNHQIDGYTGSHLGTNAEATAIWAAGEMTVDLVPQGSLAEMIRAGGNGLGGVITPTGVGTLVEDSPLVEGKANYNGVDYLVMKPLRADVALICGYKVDKMGNVWYKGSARNFNPLMATAADLVIVEAENLVDVGEIQPEDVITPGVLVDYIVVREGK